MTLVLRVSKIGSREQIRYFAVVSHKRTLLTLHALLCESHPLGCAIERGSCHKSALSLVRTPSMSDVLGHQTANALNVSEFVDRLFGLLFGLIMFI